MCVACVIVWVMFLFCFKQKTAYELRISDWSSDVCSSDLATDEGVPIAKAAGRPTLSATADYQEFVVRSANSFSAPLRSANANANLTFPLYQGGRVKNSIRAADARVEAGRANLRFTEADVFTAIVSVYMDVMRDDAVVELN